MARRAAQRAAGSADGSADGSTGGATALVRAHLEAKHSIAIGWRLGGGVGLVEWPLHNERVTGGADRSPAHLEIVSGLAAVLREEILGQAADCHGVGHETKLGVEEHR